MHYFEPFISILINKIQSILLFLIKNKKIVFYLFFLSVTCLETSAQALLNDKDYNDLHVWGFSSLPFRIKENKGLTGENMFHVFFSKGNLAAGWWPDKNSPETFDISGCFVLPKDSILFSFNCESLKIDSLSLKINLYKNNEIFQRQLIYPLDSNGGNYIGFKNTDATIMDVSFHGKSMMQHDSIALKIKDFNVSALNSNFLEVLQIYQPSINTAVSGRRA